MEHTTKVGVEKEGRRKECRNKRDRGSRKGKGELEKEGEGEEMQFRMYILGNVSRCPGLVLVERPRSDLHQLQIPSEHQAQHFFCFVFA